MNEEDWLAELDQRAEAAGALFGGFVKTIAALRHPQSGCPWDLEQDHKTLRRFMLEEAYEAAEAMLGDDEQHLLEELGDVLLQVVLNAQLTSDRGVGDIRAVITGIEEKMRRRHPHVFGLDKGGNQSQSRLQPVEVKVSWEAIKKAERRESDAGIETFASEEKIIPALTQAYKIGKKAKKIDFDWKDSLEVLGQLRSELGELEAELRAAKPDRMAIEQELGDVFFTLAQLARHLDFEPEAAAQAGNVKFLKRFKVVEAMAKEGMKSVEELTQSQLEDLWKKAKKKK